MNDYTQLKVLATMLYRNNRRFRDIRVSIRKDEAIVQFYDSMESQYHVETVPCPRIDDAPSDSEGEGEHSE